MTEAHAFSCPCCGFLTLEQEPGGWEICAVCGWEDDPLQSLYQTYKPGANRVSLEEAHRNFEDFGASAKDRTERVRPPRMTELPTASYVGSWNGTAAYSLPPWIRGAWNHRQALRTAYGDIYQRVHDLLKLSDPAQVGASDPDEYVEVVDALLPALEEAQSARDARRCLRGTLIERYLGAVNSPRSTYHAVADEIWELWQQKRGYL